MAMGIWLPGGGGADLDAVTASAGDVLAGKVIVGPDGEPLTGTLALSGNASDGQVLSGQTYYDTDAKTKRTGTMPNRGTVNQSLAINGSYTIPAGYHNGNGKVTQSVKTKGAQTFTPGRSNQVIGANQWLSGVQTIMGDPNLKPENIKKGVTIFGNKGTHEGFVPSTYDIYNRGSWGSGYGTGNTAVYQEENSNHVSDNHPTSNSQYLQASMAYEASAIRCHYTSSYPESDWDSYKKGYFRITKAINLTPYSKLNFTVSKVFGWDAGSNLAAQLRDVPLRAAILNTSNQVLANVEYYNGGKQGNLSEATGEVTGSINISNLNVTGYFSILLFDFEDYKGRRDNTTFDCYVHRIWFS